MTALLRWMEDRFNGAIRLMGGSVLEIDPEVRIPRVDRLYEMAKRDQWNASVRLADLRERPAGRTRGKDVLRAEERDAVGKVFSQLYYGERGAQIISSQLTTMVEHNEAAKFLSSQAYDEARHVEVFESMLTRVDRIHPINPFLHALLTDISRCGWVDEKVIGMNLLVEGLALGVFLHAIEVFESHPRLKHDRDIAAVVDAVRAIVRDESRHVGFGAIYVREMLGKSAPMWKWPRLHARQVLWMLLMYCSVKYHQAEARSLGLDLLPILQRILSDHHKRVSEIGVRGVVGGETLGRVLPYLDSAADKLLLGVRGAATVPEILLRAGREAVALVNSRS